MDVGKLLEGEEGRGFEWVGNGTDFLDRGTTARRRLAITPSATIVIFAACRGRTPLIALLRRSIAVSIALTLAVVVAIATRRWCSSADFALAIIAVVAVIRIAVYWSSWVAG